MGTMTRDAAHKEWVEAFAAVKVAFDAFYPNLDDPEYLEAVAAAEAAGETLDNWKDA